MATQRYTIFFNILIYQHSSVVEFFTCTIEKERWWDNQYSCYCKA